MKKIMILILLSTLMVACSSSNSNNGIDLPSLDSEWSIPVSEVLDGGPGRDGIPALVNPQLVSASEAGFIEDEDLVILFKNGDDVRAYPHIILDWHEIINENVGDVSLAITFCPLTGTGIGWGRIINGNETTFGVSGLLYNTNLIPFDRETQSNWSQILNESVNGELLGRPAELYQLWETNWATAKQMYPNVDVVGTDTGFSRTYGTSPYGNYNTNNDLFFFPVSKDGRLPLKEKVLAILDDTAKVYRFTDFLDTNLIRDTFNGKEYLLIGNEDFMFSYSLTGDLSGLEFNYVLGDNPERPDIVMEDNEGNLWNVFGEAVSGPREGQIISTSNAMMAQWFSIPAFYETEIYNR
ncbi:DUF3179 domain-containing (seleno)protein [Maribacter sp. 2304DJ31-5]|uniref:DUF3179 domain-containing (seleno)protein n=1 Tax=Maribacter sp. 2304DJ31-5 TaxID=3386273 RepID=UPI0039BD626E